MALQLPNLASGSAPVAYTKARMSCPASSSVSMPIFPRRSFGFRFRPSDIAPTSCTTATQRIEGGVNTGRAWVSNDTMEECS